MYKTIGWFFSLAILVLRGFSRPVRMQNCIKTSEVDTLPQVQVISKRTMNRREWKAFSVKHSLIVLDSNVFANKHFIHWVKNSSAAKKGVPDMSPFPKPKPHYWGLLEKVGKKWELTQLLVAPSNMSLQIQDAIDFNGDSHSDLVIFWKLRHYYNHEFGTGNNQSSGLVIWDVKTARNLVSMMFTSSGAGWNMCSGKSSRYSNHYYDVKISGHALLVKDFSKSTQPDSRIYLFARNRFEVQN
jgi:hypothetical protein